MRYGVLSPRRFEELVPRSEGNGGVPSLLHFAANGKVHCTAFQMYSHPIVAAGLTCFRAFVGLMNSGWGGNIGVSSSLDQTLLEKVAKDHRQELVSKDMCMSFMEIGRPGESCAHPLFVTPSSRPLPWGESMVQENQISSPRNRPCILISRIDLHSRTSSTLVKPAHRPSGYSRPQALNIGNHNT